MKIYLVDTENVAAEWSVLADKAKKKDLFILFYTNDSQRLSYHDLRLCSKNKLEYVRCHAGQNALDFQLVSYMGYLIRKTPEAKYIIVSRDKGYDPVVQFWKEEGIRVKREDFREDPIKLLVNKTAAPEKDKKELNKILTAASTKGEKAIKDYTYKQLIKTFNQDRGLQYYKKIRKHLVELCCT